MSIYVDNILLRHFIGSNEEGKIDSLLQIINSICKNEQQNFPQITLGWPSFLEYIGLGHLNETFPALDENNKVYQLFISTLASTNNKELIYHLYDQIFIECLNFVQSQPELKLSSILHLIYERKNLLTKEPLLLSINKLEKTFSENPKIVLHDLTLYLAWDYVCIYLAQIFEKPSINGLFFQNIQILRECLLESFSHIKNDRRTIPSYFRLLESLYAYMMKEENLDKHTEEEWQILCSCSKALMDRRFSCDLYYIDLASQHLNRSTFFTIETPEKILIRKKFVEFMTEIIRKEQSDWRYSLNTFEVICLEEKEGLMVIKDCLFI